MNINDTIKSTNLTYIYANTNFFSEIDYLNACIFLNRKNSNVLQFCTLTSVDVSWTFFRFQEIFASSIEMQQILTKPPRPHCKTSESCLRIQKKVFHFKLFVICLTFKWVECVKMCVVSILWYVICVVIFWKVNDFIISKSFNISNIKKSFSTMNFYICI